MGESGSGLGVDRRSWLRKLTKSGTGTRGTRLVCFPYAGGGASAYRAWADLLHHDVELWAVQPPAREERLFETPSYDLSTLSESVESALATLPEAPTAFFGHSLGAVTAWETARRMRWHGGSLPVHLFVSGCRALPRIHRDRRDLHGLPDEALIEEIRRMNGTPEEILSNPDFMRLVLPAFRADYRLLSEYRHEADQPPPFPVTVLGGTGDPATTYADLVAWSEVLGRQIEPVMLPGDHFFLHTARKALIAELTGQLGITSPPAASA
jgi:medium-chain acyl-[acyl-carrier-protein] hydrolase